MDRVKEIVSILDDRERRMEMRAARWELCVCVDVHAGHECVGPCFVPRRASSVWWGKWILLSKLYYNNNLISPPLGKLLSNSALLGKYLQKIWNILRIQTCKKQAAPRSWGTLQCVHSSTLTTTHCVPPTFPFRWFGPNQSLIARASTRTGELGLGERVEDQQSIKVGPWLRPSLRHWHFWSS